MDTMRFTIVDRRSRMSFVGPKTALLSIVAVCSSNPNSVEELLERLKRYQPALTDSVHSGIAVFDEHNTPDHLEHIHAALDFCKPQDLPPFRVLDARTRDASLIPVRAGVVLFNLSARRIVQIQNTYSEIQRKGKVRVMDTDTQRVRVQAYELPADWSLVPER